MTEPRFRFGRNWQKYSVLLSGERIEASMRSLREMLPVGAIEGRRFVDIGCGSGLFSLAAVRSGAKEVISFDYDADSVRCTEELKAAHAPTAPWTIVQASVLDLAYLQTLGTFDVVYSWGVLHHTGEMWRALHNVAQLVAPRGALYIAIYNDQGWISQMWYRVKRLYNSVPSWAQWLLGNAFFLLTAAFAFFIDIIKGRSPVARYRGLESRGMHAYYDAIDWIGGYPFETATADEVARFYRERGFYLVNTVQKHGSGCNEFVFVRS